MMEFLKFDFDIYTIVAIIGFSTAALLIDLKTRRIPNWLTVSIAVSGFVYHLFAGGWGGLWMSLGGFLTGFGVLLVLWLIGGGGGGDVKLMGGIGAWMGALPTFLIFIGSALFAVVCTIAIILWSNFSPRRTTTGENKPIRSVVKQTIPYALPVAMSIWALFLVRLFQG
jgi:prepilin peptidase CpaA